MCVHDDDRADRRLSQHWSTQASHYYVNSVVLLIGVVVVVVVPLYARPREELRGKGSEIDHLKLLNRHLVFKDC